jgi:hypothetical protein
MPSYRSVKLLLYVFLILLFATNAVAGTGTCTDDPATVCKADNTCDLNDCTIWIRSDPSTNQPIVSTTSQGPNKNIICVHRNKVVTWKEGQFEDRHASFLVKFGLKDTPFKGNMSEFPGTSIHPTSTGTILSNPPSYCYKYSVRHCTSAFCKDRDPKVVINPVRLPPAK